ncbi:MAG: hypothetical protein AB7N73_14625 [Gemmatimonadales bacterium]
MSTEVAPTRRRKARGTAKDRKALYLEVDPAAVAKIELVANALGRSKASTLELMLAAIDVDEHGRPEFWEGPLPADLQEELPLQSAS